MTNKKQLKLLKKDKYTWNKWIDKNPDATIDLSGADLSSANLGGVKLRGADLSRADLFTANLRGADLSGAFLNNAEIITADLFEANLRGANLKGAILIETNLSGADLFEANLSGANLRGADLRGAILIEATLSKAKLNKTVFTGAHLSYSDFGNVDLSACIDLDTINYEGPSSIGTDTLQLSKVKIPIEFLKGCGLSDWEITAAALYDPNLSNQEINNLQYEIYDLRAQKPFQISPLFISYSHDDSHFVEKLEKDLTSMGIRYWRDVHHATAGRLEKIVDRAIRHNPTVLIVFSENSIQSDWVRHEVESARELEKEIDRDVICPIALDDSWKNINWPKRLMRQVMEYNILDFSEWNNHAVYKKNFKKLIDGLELFYSE
jgi:uncharacterized protein YjbI with pentapeptide repeats